MTDKRSEAPFGGRDVLVLAGMVVGFLVVAALVVYGMHLMHLENLKYDGD